ncbi:MAG: hypothetical protein JXP73_12830 [Deltaproteobacteria bacterium]|nr:hypothetical protein [Deltaproteobacteria bacterium]
MKRVKSTKLTSRKGASWALVVGPLTFLLVAGTGCQSFFESTDDQGDPSNVSWTVRALDGVDGGDLDAEGLDAEPVDVEAADAEPDVSLGEDAGVGLDVQAPQLDGGPLVVDAETLDTEPIDGGAVDVGVVIDVPRAPDLGAEGDIAGDTAPDAYVGVPEPGPDTAPPPPEAVPDAAVVPVNPDVAPPVNDDAAVPPVIAYEYKGGGFCAISSSRSASPAGFALLALAGLALLRRRRRS